MTFSNDKPIYIQMADRLCDEILSGKYQDDDRIPSVREYAVLLEVNTNTAVKAYEQTGPRGDYLQQAWSGLLRDERCEETDPQGPKDGVYESALARALPADAVARHLYRRCCG